MHEPCKARGSSFEINVISNLPWNCCTKSNSLISHISSYLVGIWETLQQFSLANATTCIFFLPCSLSSSCLCHGLLPNSTVFEYHPSRMTSQRQQKMTSLICDACLWDYYTETADVALHMAVMLKDAPCHTSQTCLSVHSPKWVTSLLMQGTCLFSFPLEGNTTAITLREKQSKLVNAKGREEKPLKWHLA